MTGLVGAQVMKFILSDEIFELLVSTCFEVVV